MTPEAGRIFAHMHDALPFTARTEETSSQPNTDAHEVASARLKMRASEDERGDGLGAIRGFVVAMELMLIVAASIVLWMHRVAIVHWLWRAM